VIPIGDWYVGPGDRWVYDPNAPGPDPAVTKMQPMVPPAGSTVRYDEHVDHVLPRSLDALHGEEEEDPDDHEVAPIDPGEFPAFDAVDSRMIRTIGAPE